MMELGMYTAEMSRPDLSALFAAIYRLGLSQIQFDFSSAGCEQLPDRILPQQARLIAEQSRQAGLTIIAVNGTFNMIHPDLQQRKLGLIRFAVVARACRDLGCRILTICTGSRDPENMWRYHPDSKTPQAWYDLRQMMEQVLEIACRYDLVLGLECEAANSVYSAKKARQLLQECRSRHLKIIMDAANLFQEGQARPEFVRPVLDEAFDLLGEEICLAHGKDLKAGSGLAFTHAGSGIIDFPYYLAKLKACGYQGGLILHGIKDEAWFPESIAHIRKIIPAV